MGLGRRDGNAGRGDHSPATGEATLVAGVHPGATQTTNLHVDFVFKSSSTAQSNSPRSQDGSITCTERPDWRRRARERQRRHPRRSPNFRFPRPSTGTRGPGNKGNRASSRQSAAATALSASRTAPLQGSTFRSSWTICRFSSFARETAAQVVGDHDR